MFEKAWQLIRQTIAAYIEDGAPSRGAAIAYFAVTSIAPMLVIIIAIAGLVVGEDAARGRLTDQLGGLLGNDSAQLLQTAVKSASSKSSGIIASILGVIVLGLTASGVFGEMQAALNAIWKVSSTRGRVSRLVRARLASLGLVVILGFLLLVSLAVSAALTALGDYLDAILPFGKTILSILNFLLSFALISTLFAAIYKVLPDKKLEWQDVWVGGAGTALLFSLGKTLIALYIGSSKVASSYGAAGALVILLFWIYYSTQIFLLGAEFTKVYATHHGSLARYRFRLPGRAAAPPAQAPGLPTAPPTEAAIDRNPTAQAE